MFWPTIRGSIFCKFGIPSRKMMRVMSLSAWCISSINSSRSFLAMPGEAPIVEQPVMQPILIDGGQLTRESLLQVLDDPGIPFHASFSFSTYVF